MYWLSQVREEEGAKPLPGDKYQDFHHVVAQLLFLLTRVQRNIQTDVYFLTARVKLPNEYDRGKVKRVLKYLKGTKYMKLNLSVETL